MERQIQENQGDGQILEPPMAPTLGSEIGMSDDSLAVNAPKQKIRYVAGQPVAYGEGNLELPTEHPKRTIW